MPFAGAWCKMWIYFGFVFAWSKGARPRFDTSTDMGLVLIPADAEVDSVIFRLRATDQDADFPLVFEITATITPVVRIDNLPCTLYNKVCQANVILTKRLIPGRLHDFAVRVRDSKGDSNSMQATISVTNATTPRDKIFPHIPSLIMVPEDTKPGKELDYLLVRANSWSGKPVYIELWQPKELFTIRQRQTPTQTRGIITLIGELDFETQSMYTLTMYATDPYTEPGKDTRNIAGLNLVVVVQDVQDVPPIFTLAPPLTRINNTVQPGDIILRVHAEDGDKGVPREIVYGLVSEGNPFTPFFNISETTGEIVLARPLEELTQITHVGAPVVLTVVAEEIRRSREEPPAQATVVDVGFLLGEPGNSPPYFESDNYVATIDENMEPGNVISFGEQYLPRVRDEDIGKAGVFALKLENNNGTFEIIPTVAERTADFIIKVRDNTLIDYELYKSLSFKIIAQEVGPATNLSTSVPATIFLRDINDNPPVFDEKSYEVTLSENATAGTRVVQVHATDEDAGSFGNIRYTGLTGQGSEAFTMDPDTGLITVAMGSSLDREIAPSLLISVEARDENGTGNSGVVTLIVNLLDVNDNTPLFEKEIYEFMLNSDLSNFTTQAVIKAIDADSEPPNNEVRYELIHGNYENKFYLNEITGELILRSPITKIRRKKQSAYEKFAKKNVKELVKGENNLREATLKMATTSPEVKNDRNKNNALSIKETIKRRRKRANEDSLYTLTARAYDLGVPHLSSVTQIRIVSGIAMEARIVMFVVPGEHPDSTKTAETLAAITGGRVTVLETRPYGQQNQTNATSIIPGSGKKSIVVARVEQTEPGTPLVDLEKIRETLAANGVGIIGGPETVTETSINTETKPTTSGATRTNDGQITNINNTITNVHNEEVTGYKEENKLLFWLLIILGLLMLLAIAALIICCICPGCPFYMAPRKKRIYSSEALIVRSDGRPKRHLHRKPPTVVDVMWNGRKQAWSADPTRRNWQFNRRNVKNCGQSSLPGDVAYISRQSNDVQVNVEPLRARDGPIFDPSRRSRVEEQERMYLEDVEGQKARAYDAAEIDSLHQNELERESDAAGQGYRQRSDSRYIDPDVNEGQAVREQHFYREGNAEVLRLVTRGQVDDTAPTHHRQAPTLIVDGKDIILKRFIEDQKSRHDVSMKDFEIARSMESHQRSKDICQQQAPEIILIPERLDLGHRKHIDDLGPNVQRLVIDHCDYGSQKIESKDSHIKEAQKQEREENIPAASISERPSIIVKEHLQAANAPSYSFHDLELARQNALLTRLLLERENRQINVGVMDATSYLETQSLPGQVAIATQTDRTTATQTERQVRSRSDNDESDDDARYRKKKWKKKYSGGDWKKTRTLWMKSPIEEEGSPCFDKRLSILRKKVREVKEGRKISLEPNVLREISDSLDGNGSSYKGEEDGSTQTYKKSTEQTSIRYKILNEEENGSASSTETCKDNYEKVFGEKTNVMDDDKIDATESTSSPERKIEREVYARGKKDDKKTPRKETKVKKKSDGKAKPSFRILEREITMLTKKLSKLGNKKVHDSTGSDSTSQVRSKSLSRDSKKDSDQKSSKKPDISTVREQKQSTGYVTSVPKSEQTVSQRKDAVIAKTKHKLKYQQTQVMSTGSSEYDDTFEKPKKQTSAMIQEAVKQKQLGGQSQAKIKRQAHVDRRELKKQKVVQSEEKDDSQKDRVSMEDSNLGVKFEKSEKLTHAPKLADISRVGKVVEEFITSESSNGMENKRGTFALVGSSERNNTESSENDSNRHIRVSSMEKVAEEENYSVAESKKEDVNREMVSQEETMDVKEEEEVGRIDTRSDSERRSIKSEVEDPDTMIEKSDEGEHGVLKGFLKQTIDVRDISKQLVSDDLDSFTGEKEKDDLATSSFEKAKKSDEKESTEVTTVNEKEETREEVGTSPPADSKSIIEKYSTDELIDRHDKQLNEITGKMKEVIEDKFEQDAKEEKLLEDTETDMKKTAEMEFLKGKGLQRGTEERLQELEKEDQVFSDIEKDIESKLAGVKGDSDKEIRIDSAKGSSKGSGKGSGKGSDKDSDEGSAKDSVKGSTKGSHKDSPKGNATEEISTEYQEQEFEHILDHEKSGNLQTAEELTMKFIEKQLPSDYKKFTEQIIAEGSTEYETKDEEDVTEHKDRNIEIQEFPDIADVSPETKGLMESFESKDDYFKEHEEARKSSDSIKPAETDISPEISKSDDHIVSIEDTLSETKEVGIESKQQDSFRNVNIPDKHHMITEVTTPERSGDDGQYEEKDISSGTMKPDEHHTEGASMPREIMKIDTSDISSDDGASITKKDDGSVNVEGVSTKELKVDDFFDNRKDISIEADKIEDHRKSEKSISPEITETDDHRIDSKEASPKVTEHDDHGTSASDILTEKMKAEDHRVKKDSPEIIKSDDHYGSATDSSRVESQVDDHHTDEKDISTKILKTKSRDSSTEDVPAKLIVPDEPLSTQAPKVDDYSPTGKDTTSEVSKENDHELSTKHVPSEITDSDEPSGSQKDIFLEAAEADEHYVGMKDVSPELPKTSEQYIVSKDITLKIPETDELHISTEDISPESKTSDQYVTSEQISEKITVTEDYGIGAKDVSQKVPDTDKHDRHTVDVASDEKKIEDYYIDTKEISPDSSKIGEHSVASTDILSEEIPDSKDFPPKTLETEEHFVIETVSQETSKSKSDSVSPKDGSPEVIKTDEHCIEKDIPSEIVKPGDDEISTQDTSSKVPQDDSHHAPKEDISPKVSEVTDHDCTEQHFVPKVLKPDKYDILQETSSKILEDEVHKIIPKDVSPKCVSDDINKDVSTDILKTGDHSTAEDSAPLETLKSVDSFPEISKDDDKDITKIDVSLDKTKIDDQSGKTESILSETVTADEFARKKGVSVESQETQDHVIEPEIISSKLSKPDTYLLTKQGSSSEKSRTDEDSSSNKGDGSGKSTVGDIEAPTSKSDKDLFIQSPELQSSSENIPTSIQQHSEDENLKESPISRTKGKDDDQNEPSETQTQPRLEVPVETLKRLSEEMIMMEKLQEEEDKKFHTSSIHTVAFPNLNNSSNDEIAKSKESDTQENKLTVEILDGKLKSTNGEDKEPKVSEASSGDEVRATTETEQITGEPDTTFTDKKRISVEEIPEQDRKLEEPSEDKTTIPELIEAKSTDSKDPQMKTTADDQQETEPFEETLSTAIEIPITSKQEIDPSTSEIPTDLKTMSEPKEHRETTDKTIDLKKLSKPKEYLETDEKLIQSTESQQSIVDEPLMAKRDESEPIKSDIESKYIKFPKDELNERDVVREMREDEKNEGKTNETGVSADNAMKEEDKEKTLEGEHLNVNVPLFENIIGTGEDSDESDSSSDISRKTTLTRPYQTPRHHRATSVNKSVEMEGVNKPQNTDSDEESTLTIELVEDKHFDSASGAKVDKKTEDIDAREFPAVTLVHKVADGGRVELNKGAKVLSDVEGPIVQEKTTEDVSEPVNETKSTVLKPDIKHLQPPSTSVERSEDLTSLESAADLKPDYLPSTSKKDLKDSKLESKSNEGLSTTAKVSKDVKTVRKKSTSKPDDQTASEKHLGGTKSNAGTKQINETDSGKMKSQSSSEDSKTGPQKIHERKTKQAEKVKQLSRKKKKGSPEEKIEEKPTTQDPSHASRHRQPKQLGSDQTAQKDSEATKQKKSIDDQRRRQSLPKSKSEKEKKSGSSDEKSLSPPKTGEIDTSKTQSKYMAWYKKKREEMEKRRAELKTTDDEEHLPKWLRRSMKKSDKEEKMKSSQKTAEMTPRTRRKVKPLINVESEQLKAIVRQGRKLRKAEGGSNEDPPVQIFASTPPATTAAEMKHHLVQHSEYKYEKVPPPFYLHPPPAPHPSPQLSPEHFEAQGRMECEHLEEHPDPSIGVTLQGGNRLRHQQLLEKKSVFDIAYSEAAPSQLRADSTTPPS